MLGTMSIEHSPCPMRTKPVMVMMIRARILATVKTSWILVAALTLTRFTKVNIPSNRKVIKVNIPSNKKVRKGQNT